IPIPIPRFNFDRIPRKQIRLNTLSLLKNRNGIQSFDFCEYGMVFPTFIISEPTKELENDFQLPIFQANIMILHITLEVGVPDYIEVQHGHSN
ncbi:hypothetical protein H6F38_32630, partial [Paenibacillus sp. EKM208P]